MKRKKIIGGAILLVGLSTAGLVGVASADSGSEPKITCSTEALHVRPGAQTTKAAKATKAQAGAEKSTAVRNEDGTVTKNAPGEPPAGAAAHKVTHKVEIKDGKVLFDGKPAPAGSGCDSASIKTVHVTEGAPPATR